MEITELKSILEALIFASDQPLSLDRIAGVLEGEDREDIKTALDELVGDYDQSDGGLRIEKVAGGFQLRTDSRHSPWIKRLFKTGPQKISRAAMEALAIVAYRQPVTRAELESIRGVDSAGVIRTLMDKRLVKITGRKDCPGRPPVYGTTREFLETFDLKNLSQLPSLKEIELALEEEIGPGEDTEDTGRGGNSLEAQGRGDDPRGKGPAEQEDGN